MRKIFYVCSFLITGVLFLSGCDLNSAEIETVEAEAESTVKEESDNLLSANGINAEELTVEEEPIVIETDNSYIFEDLCKVSENYDESEGAPIELVVSELRKDYYEGMILLSHAVEEGDTKLDNVKYKIVPQNISGKGPQYIVCNACFEEDGDTWKLISNGWTEWDVEKSELNGSAWECDDAETEKLSKLFADELPNDGKMYVAFRKNLNIITPLMNDDASILETKIGTNFKGTLEYIALDEKAEVEFSCMEGIVNDEGKISFKIVTDAGEEYFTPGEGSIYITNSYLDYVTGGDSEAEYIDTFEVNSESIFYGGWKKEIASTKGNVSPELSWEKVEGATQYAVLLVDLDEGNYHLQGYGLVSDNHIDAGALNKAQYVGPYLEGYHYYKAYVFALREDVSDVNLLVDNQNVDEASLIKQFTKKNSDNVISFGNITCIYDFF